MQETGVDSWVMKMPWRREWQPTPVFLPGKSHGQRNLAGLQSMALHRVGHDWTTDTHTQFYFDRQLKGSSSTGWLAWSCSLFTRSKFQISPWIMWAQLYSLKDSQASVNLDPSFLIQWHLATWISSFVAYLTVSLPTTGNWGSASWDCVTEVALS